MPSEGYTVATGRGPVDPVTAPNVIPAPPVFRVMDVADVAVNLPSQFPTVTLQESEEPYRQLAFPVGLPEAVALTYALREVPTARPLTHTLFATVLQRMAIDLIAVRIIGRSAGTYLAELDLTGPRGREVIPSRPTDALTLALRLAVPPPILADERLLLEGGDVEP